MCTLYHGNTLVSYRCTCYNYLILKNVCSIVYGEVKLISTSSSIIIIHVLDIEVQTHLEFIHKALTSGTKFWINWRYTIFPFLCIILSSCVYTIYWDCSYFFPLFMLIHSLLYVLFMCRYSNYSLSLLQAHHLLK